MSFDDGNAEPEDVCSVVITGLKPGVNERSPFRIFESKLLLLD